MPDPKPTGGEGLFTGPRRRATDAEQIIVPGEVSQDIGGPRQSVVLLSLLSRIQILEGIASRDRLDRLFAEESLTDVTETTDVERAGFEQRLATATSQFSQLVVSIGVESEKLNRVAAFIESEFNSSALTFNDRSHPLVITHILVRDMQNKMQVLAQQRSRF